MFESTARDFIDKAIRSDRDFLQRFSPEIDRRGVSSANGRSVRPARGRR